MPVQVDFPKAATALAPDPPNLVLNLPAKEVDSCEPPPGPPELATTDGKPCTCDAQCLNLACGEVNFSVSDCVSWACLDGICYTKLKDKGASCIFDHPHDCAGTCDAKGGACKSVFGCSGNGPYLGGTQYVPDGNACTVDCVYADIGISYAWGESSAPMPLNDGNSCTNDTCEKCTGAMHTNASGPCRVGDACGFCNAGGCAAKWTPAIFDITNAGADFKEIVVSADDSVITLAEADTASWISNGASGGWALFKVSAQGKLAWHTFLPYHSPVDANLSMVSAYLVPGRLTNQDHLLAVTVEKYDSAQLFRLIERVDDKTGHVSATQFPVPSSGPYVILPDDSLLARVPGNVWLRASLDGQNQTTWDLPDAAAAFVIPGGFATTGDASPPTPWTNLLDRPYRAYGTTGTKLWELSDFKDGEKSVHTRNVQFAVTDTGALVVWGLSYPNAAHMNLSSFTGVGGLPWAAWLDPKTGKVLQTADLSALPNTNGEVTGFPLPGGGVAVMAGNVIAWTDSSGKAIGSAMMPPVYQDAKLCGRFSDGSICLRTAHRIARLPFKWSACP